MTSPELMTATPPSEQDMQIAPGSFKVLYVYTINDGLHDGRLKVGDATYTTEKTLDQIILESESDGHLFTSEEIREAAKARIRQQTFTADVVYKLEAAYLAVKPDPKNSGRYVSFRDYDVHSVLLRSGFSKKFNTKDKRVGEWFEVTLPEVKKAIQTLQSGLRSFNKEENSEEFVPITFREEQKDAVNATLKVFNNGSVETPKKFLWNAIMRFGKTLTAYELIRQMDVDANKVLIITHRPVVVAGWAKDFNKIFRNDSNRMFGSKSLFGESWETVSEKEQFVYFASIQDLRGSIKGKSTSAEIAQNESISDEEIDSLVKDMIDDGNLSQRVLSKNEDLFNTQFDLVIIDEGHEGLKTELAKAMTGHLKTKYWLYLSGTPFNIINDFSFDEVFSWSYVDERRACELWNQRKDAWEKNPDALLKDFPGERNPYGELPKIKILTYDISEVFDNYENINPDETKFNFGKFFEVDLSRTVSSSFGREDFHPFKNEAAVRQLLDLMTTSDERGKIVPSTGLEGEIKRLYYPFSRNDSKSKLAHTFWLLPTIPAATALQELLNHHQNFDEFVVINATGNNAGKNTLETVEQKIRDNSRTITLSVGQLTTGTTIPEWTGVFMLSNMKAAMQYMQTIFRVKSAGSLPDGRVKEVGYVFDFDPDRALEVVKQAAVATIKTKTAENEAIDKYMRDELERNEIEQLLKYLPIISYEGARFVEADSNYLMRRLDRIFISDAVDKGFDCDTLYNFDDHGITAADLKLFEATKKVVGANKVSKAGKIKISESKLSKESQKILDRGRPEEKSSKEEKADYNKAVEEQKSDRENITNLISILRAVSVRIPMLVFASDPSKPVTVQNFTTVIDDPSWKEFMPKGFEKTGDGASWENLKKFYNRSVFEGACVEIQERTAKMDSYPVLDRVAAVANLFSTFRNVDKETVLTPWSVVNRQYADTLGGLRFVDNDGLWYCKDTQGITTAVSYRDYLDSQETTNPLMLSPQWTEVEADLKKFWNSAETTILDVNSKTALYPLFAAASLWWKTINNPNRGRRAAVGPEFEETTWSEIVEHQIFINCRVLYSRAIAQRVLSGYKKQKVNASVIDVLEVRKVLKDAKLDKFTQNGDLAKAKRSLTEDEISDIWKWIFNPESIGTRIGEGKMTLADKRARMILDMAKNDVADKSQPLENNSSESVL